MTMASSNLGVSFPNISTSLSRFFSSNSKNVLFDKCHEFLRKKSTKDLNGVLDEVAKGPEPEIVFDLVNSLASKGFVPGEHTLGILMKSGVRLSDSRVGDSVLCVCLKRGELMNEYIITSYLKNQESMVAQSVLKKLLNMGYQATVMTYTVILNSFCVHNKVEKALDLFEKMKKDEKTFPNLITYSSIVSALSKNNRIDEALKYLKEMKSLGMMPNEITLTPIVKSLVSRGRYSEADECVLDGKLSCGVGTFNILVDHFAKKKDMRKMLVIVQQMLKRGIMLNVVTFNTLLDGFTRSADVISLTHVYQIMHDYGVTQNVNTINTVVNCYAKKGHLDKALDVFKTVCDDKLVPVDVFTYTPLIQELFNEGRADEAVDLYSEMRGRGIKETEVSLGSYLQGLCESGRVGDALFYFTKQRDMRLKPNLVVFNILIRFTSRLGLYQETLGLLKDLVSRQLVADYATYKFFADYNTRGFNVKKIVDDLCGAGVSVKDAYNNMSLACYEKGQFEDATWLVNEMVQKDISISERVLDHMRKKSLQRR